MSERVRVVINGQQREFIERVRRDFHADAPIEALVKRALDELGPEWLAAPPDAKR